MNDKCDSSTASVRELPTFLAKLDALRTELVDLAFVLERRGRIDAADVAVEISARLLAWRSELTDPDVRSPTLFTCSQGHVIGESAGSPISA